MRLETLKGIKEIGGFEIIVMDELINESGGINYNKVKQEIKANSRIYIRYDYNLISFTFQNGSIKENVVNGCKVDTLIEAAKLIIEGLNVNNTSLRKLQAIKSLAEALDYLEADNAEKKEEEIMDLVAYGSGDSFILDLMD